MNAEVSPNALLRGTCRSDFEEGNLDIALLVQATFNLLCNNASIIHCTRFKDTSIRERAMISYLSVSQKTTIVLFRPQEIMV